MTPTEREWHFTVANFLEALDEIAALHPEVAKRSLRYIRAEAKTGRWAQAGRAAPRDHAA
jgi:hypothetical protein